MYPTRMERWAVALVLAILLVMRPGQAHAAHLDSGLASKDTDLLPSALLAPKDPAAGEPLPRIVCPDGFQALVYAKDLKSPGGAGLRSQWRSVRG